MINEELKNDEAEATQTAADAPLAEDTAADKPTETVTEQKPDADPEVSENPETADAANADDDAVDAAGDDVESDEPTVGTEKKTVKEKAPKGGAKAKGMSKTFKLVYYPVLALVALLMIVFSVVDGVFGYKPSKYNADFYTAVNAHIAGLGGTRSQMASTGTEAARKYIVDTLDANGFALADEVKAGEDSDDEPVTTVTDFVKTSGIAVPTVTVMTAVPTAELQTKMGVGSYLVGAELSDVVAVIPSEKTAKGEQSGAVIITVRYDTRTDTAGATGNAAFVATAMQSLIKFVADEKKFDNDIVVVFTEELGESYGSYVFFDAFKGFNGVVSRAIAGVSLDAYGNAGTLALTDSSNAGLDYINLYTKASGTVFNSSIAEACVPDTLMQRGSTDAFAYADIPAVQVAVVGGIDAAQSARDSVNNVSSAILHQQAELFGGFASAFGNASKDFAVDDGALAVFSYFDWGTVAYNDIAAYVIAALTVALIAAAIAVIAVKKTFSVKKLFIALGVELLVLASSVVALFGAYFLVTLMLTGFGVLPIHAITQIRHFNAGILIAAMLVATAAAFGFTTLYKKLFKVTSSDVARGTTLMFGFAAAIMGFAAPQFSYIAAWVGLLGVALLLVTALLNGTLKDKLGFGFDRLFVYTLPFIVCAPLMFSSIAAMIALLPTVLLPFVITPFVAALGVAVPYLDRTQPLLDKVAKKLPMRTLRIERVVTEKVEDRAKKGKFTERTVKRIDKEKVAVNYKNYFGISAVAVIGCVVALFSGAFGVSYGKTLTAPHSYAEAVYNDAIVYEWSQSGGTTTQKIIVDDLIAYKYIRYAVPDLVWDPTNRYYYKTVSYNTSDIIASKPTVKKDGDGHYTVDTFDGPRSTVTLTIPSASQVTKITVTNSRGIEYEYEFASVDEIKLALPYGFGDFTLDIEGDSPSTVKYEEQRAVTADSPDNALANVDEWNEVLQYYRDSYIASDLRGGIVLKCDFSL
jgi:hypothetical protein